MAVAFRSASSTVNTTGTASVSRPTGVVAGDLLIAVHGSDSDGSLAEMTAPTGWTEVGSDARTGVGFVKVWQRIATSSEPTTYAFPDSANSNAALAVLAITGADATTPLAVVPTFAGNTSSVTGHTAPSVTGVVDGLLLTGHFAGAPAAGTRTYTPPSGMTELAEPDATNSFVALEVNGLALTSSAATGSKTATCSSAVPYTAVSLVVAPSGSGGSGGSGGTVTYRSSSEDARGNATDTVPALPTGVVEGDLLIAVQASDLNGSLAAMTAPSGWTERGSSSRTDVGFMKVWTKVAGPSEPATYTFADAAAANGSTAILAVSGQDASAPLAVLPTFASGASTTAHPAPSVAGVAGGMLVTTHLAGTSGTTRTYTPPSGMTERRESTLSSGGNICLELNTLALAAAGSTGSKSATCSASAPYVTMSLVVAPVTAAVTATPDTPDATGAAANATVQSNSAATAGRGSATGAAPAPTVTGTSRTTATASAALAAGSAFNASVRITSTSSATVTAGTATSTGVALGSSGSAAGFVVTTTTTPGPGAVFPSDALFPSDSLFPSDGNAAAPQTVQAIGIASAEAVGSPVVALADGPQTVQATSIDSDAAFGVPTVTTEVGPQTVTAVGIDTAEAVGRPTVSVEVVLPPPPVGQGWFDTYFVDGIDLSSFTTQIEVGEGLQDTPGTVGANIPLPGRDGELEVFGAPGQQRRPDGPGRLTLDMWLIGVDPDTGALVDQADSAARYQARWDELVRMFHRRRMTIDHPRPDGTRRAVGHLVPGETMAPTSRSASPWFGRFRAAITIPGAHWTDATEVTTGPTLLATNGVLSLSLFAAATAPCTELTITFGPGNNPRLSTSYGHVGWNGTIAPGRQLTIDTATGQLGYGSGQPWTPSYDGLTYAPGPGLFEIDPSEPLQAILTHTGGGSMSVEVSGKRHYRTS